MKLTNSEQAIWSVIEIALSETGKTRATDAVKANDRRVETTTETHKCALYKTPNGAPVFKATPLSGGGDIHLSGFKLLQKVGSLEEKAHGAGGGAVSGGGGFKARAEGAGQNRSVGLMRRKAG